MLGIRGYGLVFAAMLLAATGCDLFDLGPSAPLKPWGATSLSVNQSAAFYTTVEDASTDSVRIRFDFGDGAYSEWSEYVAVGETVSVSHSWNVSGTYYVKAQAKNDEGESNWSEPLMVTISDIAQSDSFILSEVSHFGVTGNLLRVAKSGNYVYLPARDQGLLILDVSNPQSPFIVGRFVPSDSSSGPWVNDVKISGSYAYIAVTYIMSKTTSVIALDITDPSSPREVGGFADTTGNMSFERLFYASGRVYVVGQQHTMGIINFTNPTAPVGEGFTTLAGYYAYDIVVYGSYAYIANKEYGVQIIDISNPQNPSFVSSLDVSSSVYGVFVSQSNLYVAAQSGLEIVDVSNPASPSIIGTVSFPDYAFGIYVSGNYAFVGANTAGFFAVDISTPSNPKILSNLDTPGNAWCSVTDGDYAYLADFNSLRIIKLR